MCKPTPSNEGEGRTRLRYKGEDCAAGKLGKLVLFTYV